MHRLLAAAAAALLAAPAAAADFIVDFAFSRDADESYAGRVRLTADAGTAGPGGIRYALTGASGSIRPSFDSTPPVYTVTGLSTFFGLAENVVQADNGVLTLVNVGFQLDAGPSELLFDPSEERVTALESFFTLDRIVVSPAAVPEPATWLTLAAGFGLVGATLRRRRVRPADLA